MIGVMFGMVFFVSGNSVEAQLTPFPRGTTEGVPRVVKFSGEILDLNGKPKTGICGVTFAFYKTQHGGAPVWIETLNINPDFRGRFTALLGSSESSGIPADVFDDGTVRWLAMIPEDGIERQRIKLSSVPYSLMSGNAEMLGGKPAAEFVTVGQLTAATDLLTLRATQYPFSDPSDPSLGSGVLRANSFDALSLTGPSFISRAMSGPPFQVQSGDLVKNLNSDMLHGWTDSAFAKINSDNDFLGLQSLRRGALLPPSTPSGAASSAPVDFQARTLTPNPDVVSDRVFRWSANPLDDAQKPSARLNFSFGSDKQSPSPTGLGINEDGTLQFAPAQQFPAGAILAAIGQVGSGDPGNPPIVYTDPYRWKQTPPAQQGQQGLKPGWNSITLSPCPNGLSGSDAWHYLYISGTGTAESVLISGGSCVSGSKSGTVEFNASFSHPVGYTIESATSGLQEAVNAAILPKTNAQSSRSIVINPGEYLLRARLSIRARGVQISGFGATLTCVTLDTCIMLGDPSTALLFARIQLRGIRLRPGISNGTAPAIEDNANGSEISDIASAQGTDRSYSFGYLIQVDNDQAAFMDRIDLDGATAIRCDKQFCGSAIYAPGPFSVRAAVGWVSHSNLSPNCAGNGIDWQSGNTLQVSDTVVQGYAQFGIRAGIARGGQGNVKLNNVYEEIGNCANPVGNIGRAGVIVQGGEVRISGGVGPQGEMPCFFGPCSSGNLRRYYVVARNPSFGNANPLAAGVSENNTGPITALWPDIPGASSYDLLVVTNVEAWYSGDSPSGTGPFAVALNIPKSNCSDGVCNYVDTQAARLSYSVGAPQYFPRIPFWPGSIVLGSGGDSSSIYDPSVLYTEIAPGGIIGELGVLRPAVFADSCQGESAVSPLWQSCLTSWYPPAGAFRQNATIMLVKPNSDAGQFTNIKGRLNFGTVGSGPSHIITLSDSNFAKTIAAQYNRPPNDIGDAYVGYDIGNGSSIGISFGAPQSLTNYIGNNGDGVNWKERLTTTLKQFKTDVQVDGNLIVHGSIIQQGPQTQKITGSANMDASVENAAVFSSDEGRSRARQIQVERESTVHQQFAYSLTGRDGTLASGGRVPSVYINRASRLRLLEVYCEVDAGSTVINLTNAHRDILSTGIQCTPAGAASTAFAEGREVLGPGERLEQDTGLMDSKVQSLKVVITYVVE